MKPDAKVMRSPGNGSKVRRYGPLDIPAAAPHHVTNTLHRRPRDSVMPPHF
jgi:hypothetical protein